MRERIEELEVDSACASIATATAGAGVSAASTGLCADRGQVESSARVDDDIIADHKRKRTAACHIDRYAGDVKITVDADLRLAIDGDRRIEMRAEERAGVRIVPADGEGVGIDGDRTESGRQRCRRGAKTVCEQAQARYDCRSVG